MEWFSRYVLSWELSLSLESDFCVLILKRALEKAKPEIFNTDQGSQFTSEAFTSVLKEARVQISTGAPGRILQILQPGKETFGTGEKDTITGVS